jgi:predicted RecA/RadA family phage recombinase
MTVKNYVQKGEILDIVAPSGGVTSGVPVLIGSLLVIPQTTAAVGELFAGLVQGVIEYTKVSAQAWTQNLKIYWDDTAKNFTSTVGSNTLVGVAAAPAANPTSTGWIRLDGVAR